MIHIILCSFFRNMNVVYESKQNHKLRIHYEYAIRYHAVHMTAFGGKILYYFRLLISSRPFSPDTLTWPLWHLQGHCCMFNTALVSHLTSRQINRSKQLEEMEVYINYHRIREFSPDKGCSCFKFGKLLYSN